MDDDENSVSFKACEVNYGGNRLGSVTLSKVNNQPMKMDIDTFKIYMTQVSDEKFEHVFQKIEEGFTISTDQQKAGFMTGTI